MSMMNDILNIALRLPVEERAALAQELLMSLEEGPSDPDHEAAWNAEIRARLERVERGEYTATDWREALARIRQTLSRGSAS